MIKAEAQQGIVLFYLNDLKAEVTKSKVHIFKEDKLIKTMVNDNLTLFSFCAILNNLNSTYQ